MKFIPIRDMRNHTQEVLSKLKKEKEMILTSHGKPIALIADLAEETFEEDLTRYRRSHGPSPRAAETAAAYGADDPEILKAWIKEAERRYDDYLSGKSKAIPAFEALEQLRKKYKK